MEMNLGKELEFRMGMIKLGSFTVFVFQMTMQRLRRLIALIAHLIPHWFVEK